MPAPGPSDSNINIMASPNNISMELKLKWRGGKYPTNEAISTRLKELDTQGVAMCYKHIMKADCALWGSINRYYPSLKDAVEQAGLHYIKVPHGYTLEGKGCKPWTSIKTPEHCPDYAYFIGVLMGDGCIHPSTVKCDGHDAEMVTNFAEMGYQLFGIEPKWSREMRRGPHRADHGDAFYRVCFHSHKLVELMLSEVGRPKKIPEWIKNGSPDIMSAFIRGFADADGCAHKKRNTFRVNMVQKDRAVLEDIKAMLASMTIVSTITNASRGCSAIYITSAQDTVKFRDLVGFTIKRKQDRLMTVVETNYSTGSLKYRRGLQ